MLYTAEHIERISQLLGAEKARRSRLSIVVDPVMVATSGDLLLKGDAVAASCESLFPLADLITPNMDEAGVLLDRKIVRQTDLEEGALELSERFGTAVLLKGGHLEKDAVDVLARGREITLFQGERFKGVKTHGTGCTLSSAIAGQLARGADLEEAVTEAKDYVHRAIETYCKWAVKGGSAIHALNHFPDL